MTLVHRLVARLFGRFPNREIHPDEAIALGAAVQAGLKMRDAALDEVVMTDVAPYSLGVEVTEEFSRGQLRAGIFLPIIERNTVIPCSRVERVGSIRDHQPLVEVKVFQGESRNVQDNILLGSLKVPLPPAPRAEQQVDIRFSYDINGLLEVEAKVLRSGAVQKLVIEQSPGAMSRKEIEASLALMETLKIHPRDQEENRALQERLKRLYEENLGDRRAWVGHQITAFDSTLESQDPRAAEKARETLGKILDDFEASPLS
jgi:molecular chaperone HscC